MLSWCARCIDALLQNSGWCVHLMAMQSIHAIDVNGNVKLRTNDQKNKRTSLQDLWSILQISGPIGWMVYLELIHFVWNARIRKLHIPMNWDKMFSLPCP